MSKEDKRELRRRAEDEKVFHDASERVHSGPRGVDPLIQSKLKHMNSMTYAFFSGSSPSCAIVPSQFYKSWKRWADSPTSQPRPESIDNAPFLCKDHQMLLYDPNSPGEMDPVITLIRRDEWEELIT